MRISNLLKTLLVIIILIVITGSCGNKNQNTVKKPSNLVQKSTITEVLIGAYIIESSLYYKNQKGINLGLYSTVYYNALFDKHKITKKQFCESLTYYIETDNDVSAMFLNVINKLMTLQNGPVSIPQQP
jgi:hypothetical protein